MKPRFHHMLILLLKGCIFFITLAGIILLVHSTPMTSVNRAWIHERVLDHGLEGILAYVTLVGIASALGFPRQILSFLGGYAFGIYFGVFWATVGTTFGCAMGFFYARIMGRSIADKFFSGRVSRLNSFLAKAPFSMALILRCLPVGHNAVTNLLAGVSAVPALGFISGSFVGYIPQNLIFAILGSGIRLDPFWNIALSTVLFVASSLLGYTLYRRYWLTPEEDARDGTTTRPLSDHETPGP